MIKHFLAACVLCMVSGSAFALTSICSADGLPQTGLTTLKHEAVWSYYDNWFYNMFVEISSEVEGPVSPTLVDQVEMNIGGSALQFLDGPVDGTYSIRGGVQVGYPVSWGFEGYYAIECPPWIGEIVNPDSANNLPEDARLIGLSGDGQLVSVSEPGACGNAGTRSCSSGDDETALGASTSAETQPGSERGVRGNTTVLQGTLQWVDKDRMLIRTAVGRLMPFSLTSATKVMRHQKVSDTAIGAGDRIGVYWSSAQASDTGALQVRLYRQQTPDQPQKPVDSETTLIPSQNPGIELVAIVSDVERSTQNSLRLVYAHGSKSLLVPHDATVTVIEPVLLSDLIPRVDVVRVISQQSPEGEAIVHTIELHQ